MFATPAPPPLESPPAESLALESLDETSLDETSLEAACVEGVTSLDELVSKEEIVDAAVVGLEGEGALVGVGPEVGVGMVVDAGGTGVVVDDVVAVAPAFVFPVSESVGVPQAASVAPKERATA